MAVNFRFWKRDKAETPANVVEKSVPTTEPNPILEELCDSIDRYSRSSDYLDLFYSLPEIAFPIVYITSRMKNADIVLRRYADDSEVWSDSGQRLYGDEKAVSDFVRAFVKSPNFRQNFSEFTEQYFMQRYLCGSSFVYAMGAIDGIPKWRNVRNFHVIPSRNVEVDRRRSIATINATALSDLVQRYRVNVDGRVISIDPHMMLFTRDIQHLKDGDDIKGYSRIRTQQHCVDNLVAVYSARFNIYDKRGAIGAIVNEKKDADTNLPLTPDERNKINDQFVKKYGVTGSRFPFMLLDGPLSYMNLSASISELQPFVETQLDAAQIAGIFQIKKELIPREGNSTFSNQESAEISAYNDMVIPEMKVYLDNLTSFLNLDTAGLYLDAKWDKVEILKKTKRDGVNAEQTKFALELGKFKSGIITLNEALGNMGMEAREGDLYDKTVLEMTPEELGRIAALKQL